MPQSETTPATVEQVIGLTTETTIPAEEYTTTGQSISPVVRILKKPKFLPVLVQSERTRFHPILVQSNNAISPDTSLPPTKSQPHNNTDCPPGQIPNMGTASSSPCIACPKGHYRPRIKIAILCRPCSPGFYQERSGQSSCNRCRNVPIRYLSVLRNRVGLRGFTSNEQCTLVDAYIGSDSPAARTEIPRNSFRRRYRRFRHH